jgi:hypothetical protein
MERIKCRGKGSGKASSRILNLQGALKINHQQLVPGMTFSLSHKGHSAEAVWVVCEDAVQGLESPDSS